jgi:hypothetical protein
MALTVDGNGNGANVMQSPATTALNDNWAFVPTSDGYYHVIAQHSGYALSALGKENGANVVTRLTSQSKIDDWCFVPVDSNLYQIRNRLSGKSVDVADFSTQSGGNVHQWSFGDQPNQKFSVVVAGGVVPTPVLPTPRWLAPVETPVVAVAAANLADGRVLMWSSASRIYFGFEFNGVSSTQTWTAIYDPVTGM